MQIMSHPLEIGRELATKKIIRQFARKHGWVYFGHVDQREAEHELIHGITVSASHADSHFCVGQHDGFDVSIVDRRNTISYPEQPPQQFRWLIMQFDLKREDLPHVFIDANHHDEAFYATLFMRFANFTNASSLFVTHDPLFERSFRVFAPVDKFDEVEELFVTSMTAGLAHHFRQFDYELQGDRLLVYANNPVVSPHLLQEMLRAGAWFAGALEHGTKPLLG